MKKYHLITIKSFFIIFLFSLIISLNSCNFEPITKHPTQNIYNATRGDSLMINWHFENADRVFIDNFDKSFQPIDSVKILADSPKNLNVWAYKGNIDSLLETKVLIINGESAKIDSIHKQETEFTTIQRGPIKIYKEYQEVRGMESNYLRGVITSNSAVPTNLKITSVIDNQEGNNLNVKIRFLLLDNYGNFINNDNLCNNKHLSELKYNCRDNNFTFLTFDKCKKEYQEKRQIGNEISILFDNSFTNEGNEEIISNIYKAATDLAQNDKLQLIEFNHRAKEIRPLKFISDDIESLKTYKTSSPNGLNSLYKILYQTIDNTPYSNNNKATIVITHSGDNSSLIYKISDIINVSKSKQSPIYIIAVGDALQTYFLNYICSKTGGKLYHIFNSEVNDISAIINEIYFAMNNYYEIDFADNNSLQIKNCNEPESIFSIEVNNSKLSSMVSLYTNPIPDYSQYQALALFDEKSYNFKSEYNDVLDVLVQTLKDNPNHNIQLIGHSGDEGEDTYNNYLSNLRADAVKNYLLKNGIPLEQIATKSMGYRKPLYFQAKFPWMDNLNRRVELKWINPEKLPFEINAEKALDETDAINICKEWSRRGYRTYFERIIENEQAKYQVKLWGFSTKKEAEAELKIIKSKYKNEGFSID